MYRVKGFFKVDNKVHIQTCRPLISLLYDVSKYKDLFSCTSLGSKPTPLLSKFLVHAFLDPLQQHPTKVAKISLFCYRKQQGRNFWDNEPRWRRTSGLCFRFRVLVGCIDNVTSEFAVSFRISHRSWPVGRIECLKSALMSSRVSRSCGRTHKSVLQRITEFVNIVENWRNELGTLQAKFTTLLRIWCSSIRIWILLGLHRVSWYG